MTEKCRENSVFGTEAHSRSIRKHHEFLVTALVLKVFLRLTWFNISTIEIYRRLPPRYMPTQKVNRGARPFLKWIHTWAGLTAGLVLAVISLAGSAIVFRAEIEKGMAPKSAGGSRIASLDEVARQIAQSRPDARVRRVRLPADTRDVFDVQVDSHGKQERLVCDASTGRVLGTIERGWVEWTIDLHRNLLAGKTGRKVVGGAGTVLFVLASTGMLLWLTGARKWRSWVSVRAQGGSRRFNYELHRASGLWAYALLAAISFTGIGLAYPDTFRNALQGMTGQAAASKAPRVAKSAAKALRPLDEYLRTGAAAMPDGTPIELRLEDKGPVDLRLWRRGDLSPSGNHVYLEPGTAKVLAVSRVVDEPLAARIWSAFSPIHYGEFGGPAIKAIWALIGLVPALLFITGFFTWWRPRQPKPQPGRREELEMEETPAEASR
jgi:uncharacterized iron-regulated membrane protein